MNANRIDAGTTFKVAVVTGARGLIGRYIVDELLKNNWKVRVLSRKSDGFVKNPNLTVIVSNINDERCLGNFLKGASVVFHCAAELYDESLMYNTNVLGTSYLIQEILALPEVKYFCYISSAGVIGPVSTPDIHEISSCFPDSIYERTKYEAEKVVLQANLNMNVCILRPANVFDADRPGILSLPIKNDFFSKLSLILKGGEGAHLVHARDVASAAMFFLDKKLQEPEIFFISYDSDQRNTVAGVYALVRTIITGKNIEEKWFLRSGFIYWARCKLRGKSLHGRARFSEKKLRMWGFKFPLGLKKGVADVCKKRRLINS